MIPWYFKLLQITHFVEPCVHVADSWSRIASAFDHHVDVERLLDHSAVSRLVQEFPGFNVLFEGKLCAAILVESIECVLKK